MAWGWQRWWVGVFLRTVHNEALKLALYLDTTHSANRSLRVIPRRCPVKLTNLTITPKLGILVGVTLFGLCVAGALAGYLMQRQMLNARIDQGRSIVEMALNMAAGLQKQVEAGELTKEAALAEFGRRANSMTYDKGAG